MLRIAFSIFICFCLLLVSACNQPAETPQETPQEIPADTIPQAETPQQKIYSGQIQSSGLTRGEVETIGLGNIGFQLVGQDSYFLLWDSVMQNYWGSCVEITGDEIADSATQQINLYSRKILKVKSIKAFSGPCIYASGKIEITEDKTETMAGTVKRASRPAPDIAYDYELILDKPYWETNSAYEDKMLVKSILLTANPSQVAQLETAIDKNQPVQLEGARIHGYAESIVFAVKAVIIKEL